MNRTILGPAQTAVKDGAKYNPVNCDLIDELENLSVRNQVVDVSYWGEGEQLLRKSGRISDIFTDAKKEEFLKLEDNTLVRLDKIHQVKIHKEYLRSAA